MSHIEDFYEILGLEPRASIEQIRTAYRQRARKVHPDVAGRQATAEFVRLNRAYETLIDPGRRQTYDRQFLSYRRETRVRRTAVSQWGASESVTLSSLLAEMMSLAELAEAGPSSYTQTSPIHVELILAAEAVYVGADVRLEVPVTVICENCRGSGLAEPFVCPACRGKGRWLDRRAVQFFLQPPIRDGQTVIFSLQATDVPVTHLHLHIRLSWV